MLQPSSTLFNLPEVGSSPQMRQAITLACGTVHHGLTKAQQWEPIPEGEYERITQKFVQEIEELYERSSGDTSDKMMVMKAIGNCGLPSFIDFVHNKLEQKSTPFPVRLSAIFAFRRMPQEVAQKVWMIKISNARLYTDDAYSHFCFHIEYCFHNMPSAALRMLFFRFTTFCCPST